MDVEKRIEYYWGNTDFGDIKPTQTEKLVDSPFEYTIEITDEITRQLKTFNYTRDVLRYISYSHKKNLWFQLGDSSYSGPPYPVLVKTRFIYNDVDNNGESGKTYNGVIANLNYHRHWNSVTTIQRNAIEIPWNRKSPDFVWRGIDTGLKKKYGRNYFCEKFKDYNVGYYATTGRNHINVDPYIKGHLNLDEMMKYKYLPVVEGNDKSSSFNWIVYSNCVPVMPKPRYDSWACDAMLKPNIHYVEVKEDWSDFLEKIEWCRDNDSICKEIAMNGKKFISEIIDPTSNIKAERGLVSKIDRFLTV
tara:strand:- start:372 stop:1283 length:912 start_codon:yes stop_codon:yes gene_type:complete